MRASRSRSPRSIGDGAVLPFRLLVVVPALVTLAAFAVSALVRGEGPSGPPGAVVELLPATGALALPEPRFGAPLADVFSVAGAVEIPGGWAVLDGRAQQVVFLDEEARPTGRAGGPGDGPGELSRAAHLTVLDSLLLVVDGVGRSLDVFGLDGAFRRRVMLGFPGCAGGMVGALLGDGADVVVLWRCMKSDGSVSAVVERVGLDGSRRTLLERVYNDPRTGTFDLTRAPVLALADGALYFAMLPERCVTVLEAEPGHPGMVCHPDTSPLPLADSLRARVREAGAQLGSIGATFVVPDRLPPFDAILGAGGGLAFHVVLGEREHALEIVRDGQLERFLLPPGARTSVGSRSLLLARDLPEGTAFAVLPLP